MTVVELQVLSGAMPSSIAITADVLATANRLRVAAGRAPAFAVQLRGSGAGIAGPLLSGVVPLATGGARRKADIVVVCSLVTVTEASVSARLRQRDAVVLRRELTLAAKRGVPIAASCSAVFHLAAAGLLEGRRATTTWWLAPLFQRLYPRVALDANEMVVSDGPFTTAGAAMAHLDLMLALVVRYCGRDLAAHCARFLLLDGRRSQSRYMAAGFLAAQDAAVARAERWARAGLATGLTVDGLAAAAGLAPRTFARRVARITGMSPVQFLQRLRVERAVELLETTRMSVEAVARQVGYTEPTTLRRLLRRETGSGPRELRGA
jgi:transcriptional regulator GlxA family with amidase domain